MHCWHNEPASIYDAGTSADLLFTCVQLWALKFREVPDRNAAELLRGHTVLMAAADREKLRDPDEFYVQASGMESIK